MSGDLVRHLLAADPFEPLVLSLSSRTEVVIDRPELAEVPATGDVLILKGPDGSLRQMISLRAVCSITHTDRPTIR